MIDSLQLTRIGHFGEVFERHVIKHIARDSLVEICEIYITIGISD